MEDIGMRNVAPMCPMWVILIWKEQNSQSFEGVEKSFIEFKCSFSHTLFEWCTMLGRISCNTLAEFILKLTIVIL